MAVYSYIDSVCVSVLDEAKDVAAISRTAKPRVWFRKQLDEIPSLDHKVEHRRDCGTVVHT